MARRHHPLQLGGVALTAICLAQAADYVKPDIKPGLWEVTHTPQMSGEMPIPEDQLAKMSPEQRARIEAAIKSSMSNASKPRVYKECMTPEKIARGLDLDRGGRDASCKRTIISSSASELRLHDECARKDGKSVTDLHFQIEHATRMTGTIDVVMSSAGKTMTVNSKLTGKWLGSDCGTVKDTEVEK